MPINLRSSTLLILILSLVAWPGIGVLSQEHSYMNYDVRDGLAGSTVYSSAQDKEGFIWFGTETGLSRFDGTRFLNYTTSDGLPDNEIIQILVDSRNRIWLVPFKRDVAYIYHGKIHNTHNDTILGKLNFQSELVNVAEDNAGNILFQDKKDLQVMDTAGRISVVFKVPLESPLFVQMIGLNPNGNFRVNYASSKSGAASYFDIINNKMVPVNDKRLDPFGFIPHFFGRELDVIERGDQKLSFVKKDTSFTIPFPKGFISFSYINDKLIALNTYTNSLLLDLNQCKIVDTFLKGLTVNRVMEDREGNYWFNTLGRGVFRMGSRDVINYYFKGRSNDNVAIFCIKEIDSMLYFGGDKYLLCRKAPLTDKVESFEIYNAFTRGRIMGIVKGYKNELLAGTDGGLIRVKEFGKCATKEPTRVSVKSLQIIDDSLILESSNMNCEVLRMSDLSIKNHFFYNRSAAALRSRDGTYYIAMLNGLCVMEKNGRVSYPGEHQKILANRITDIKESADGTIWLATDEIGIIGYRDGKVIASLSEKQGLTSNICRSLFVTPDAIWVGTNKGVNKVMPTLNGYQFEAFTISDGLSSDLINALYVKDHLVYAGTSEGVTVFNENKVMKNSICLLRLTGISVSGKPPIRRDMIPIVLKHQDNNIRFDYVGISYKSAGSILYQYRLLGLDTNWRTTRETYLNYPSLPSGDYEMQLIATNKFGVRSELISIPFKVEKLLWEKMWFRLMILLVIAGLLYFIFHVRVKSIRKKEMEKAGISMKMAELEQMALRSQMNPHFIFNCLNSIQQYVIYQDVQGANDFITKFSYLIRQTLNFSNRSFITLDEELGYITTYLELERKRFENKFVYDILIDENVDRDRCHIPPMILQPYIENAIRHGIGLRQDKNGKILIRIEIRDGYLVCMIEDNGVGRKLAAKYKSSNAISYQSVGMSLVAKRVEMINKASDMPVMITVTDMEDVQGIPTGTRIVLRFPFETVLQ